jgi:cAMP phosphodiesterase
MDHVMSLVVSAGSLAGPRKRICAVKQTLDDMESSIFNDRTWPNLASYKEDDISAKFLYSP